MRGRPSVKHFSSAKMPTAGEESVQAVLRLFETPSDAATFLCAYNERMHVASKGRSSKQSTFHRRRRELLLLRQRPSAVGRRRFPKTAALTVRADSAVSGGCGASTISKKTGWRSQPCPG